MSARGATRTLHRAGVFVEPLPVIVRCPAARPATLRLSEGSCSVGAGSVCDMVLDDSTVSRSHAELTLVPEG